MSRILFVALLLVFGNLSFGQDKKIDRLEIFYDQGYYSKVLKKARKLKALPEYDYSALPHYYESLSLFRLADNEKWFRRHNTAIDDAISSYRQFLDNEKADHYVKAHYREISDLKIYLKKLEAKFKSNGQKSIASKLNAFQNKELKGIKAISAAPEVEEELAKENTNTSGVSKTNRDKIVVYAKSFLGVKYVWSGSDEKGFDCSGFTSYVHKKFGLLLPRTANGQQEKSKKVKVDNAQKGDLVFFGPGSRITHVGLVVSDKNGELSMIHASSSKGVIITNIISSTYWKPKLKSAGTYL
ncbi:MAG: C40 family peptidase [Flavobacteriales bacterium]|jgi:cell wall-associated NlpC family hydrolase|nr:C40 family peptidase [Flavobacteriales bacterium]